MKKRDQLTNRWLTAIRLQIIYLQKLIIYLEKRVFAQCARVLSNPITFYWVWSASNFGLLLIFQRILNGTFNEIVPEASSNWMDHVGPFISIHKIRRRVLAQVSRIWSVLRWVRFLEKLSIYSYESFVVCQWLTIPLKPLLKNVYFLTTAIFQLIRVSL